MMRPLFRGAAPLVRPASPARRVVFAALLCLAPLFLGRCSVGPEYVRPSVAVPSVYKENQPGSDLARKGGWKQAGPRDTMLRGKWWQVFGDKELDTLEEKVVIDNQNIRQYFENYMAARALARNARASLFPSVAASPSATKQGSGSNAQGLPSLASAGPTSCPSPPPGNQTCSAAFATPSSPTSTRPRRAPQTWPTRPSANRRASPNITSSFGGRTLCRRFTMPPWRATAAPST